MHGKINAFKVLVVKPKENRLFGRIRAYMGVYY
jgi:hypothetical protein